MGLMTSLSELFNGSGPETNDTKYQDALGHLLQFDVGRSSYFEVIIPKMMGPGSRIRFFCHSAELPGESTATVNQKIYGINEKFPVMTGYNDITLSFYTFGSSTDVVRSLFLEWSSFITGRAEVYKGKLKPTTYNIPYKNKYVADIIISHYAIDGNPLLRVKLIDAFPIGINQTPLSWSAQNQAISLNVTFAYTEYQYEFLDVNPNGDYKRGPLGELLGTGLRVASAASTISNAFASGNPLAAASALPHLGMSNFSVSTGLRK